jgi:hypothetical protein
VARKDGENGAQAVLAYLNCITPPNDPEQILEAVRQRMLQLETRVVTGEDVARLEAIERAEAERLGLEEYKFSTNKEMLSVIESVVEQAETE